MIDLHCHLLPGLDDGPQSLEDSLELCHGAVADGITHAVATPHIHPGRWENSAQEIGKQVAELRGALLDHDIPLQLGFAAEVRLSDEVMRQVDNAEIPFYGTVDGYQIMLLEFPHGQIIPGSDNLVRWLLARGIRPLIAHPERNKQVMKDTSVLRPFIELGCWLQVTAGSIAGAFGEGAQRVAQELLDENAVAVVATDAHNLHARPALLSHAFKLLASAYGGETAQRLILDMPATIVADQFPDLGKFTVMAGAN